MHYQTYANTMLINKNIAQKMKLTYKKFSTTRLLYFLAFGQSTDIERAVKFPNIKYSFFRQMVTLSYMFVTADGADDRRLANQVQGVLLTKMPNFQQYHL